MEKDSLHQRGKALEDMFFQEKDRQLLEKLRADLNSSESKRALTAATGITNSKLLDQLLAAGIRAESLAALSLVPLVLIGWADDTLTADECKSILKSAEESGIEKSSTGYQLIQSWLKQKPDESIQSVWADYIRSVKDSVDAASFEQLKTSVLTRAKKIAEASGGFLGLGKTSSSEQNVLARIEKAF
jgi:hypothetical protein